MHHFPSLSYIITTTIAAATTTTESGPHKVQYNYNTTTVT